jgi:hypothetical protein
MTQALPKPSKTSLYDRDLNLWLEEAIAFLVSVKKKKK